MYTRLLPASGERLHELERNAEFIRELGLVAFEPGFPDLSAILRNVHAPAGSYYVLLPGSYRPRKMWPVERFARVADFLNRRTLWRGVVCGGPKEKWLGNRLLALADAALTNLAGKTSMLGFVATLSRARLVVGNDSAGIHIAAALGVPAVCILGGGQFGRFLPYSSDVALPGRPPASVCHRMPCYGCEWRCGFAHARGGPVPCVLGVTEAAVIEALGPLVGGLR